MEIKYVIELTKELKGAMSDLEKITSLLSAYEKGIDISSFLFECETDGGQMAVKKIIKLFENKCSQ